MHTVFPTHSATIPTRHQVSTSTTTIIPLMPKTCTTKQVFEQNNPHPAHTYHIHTRACIKHHPNDKTTIFPRHTTSLPRDMQQKTKHSQPPKPCFHTQHTTRNEICHQTTPRYPPTTPTHDTHAYSAAPRQLPVRNRRKPASFPGAKKCTPKPLHTNRKSRRPREDTTSMIYGNDICLFSEVPMLPTSRSARMLNCVCFCCSTARYKYLPDVSISFIGSVTVVRN